jgi:hypothetical protein
VDAFGIRVEVPDGWDARIWRQPDREPTLHAASYRLPLRDGDFGSAATHALPPGGVFLVITEYGVGGGLAPAQGLFAPTGVPHAIAPHDFNPRVLHQHRPDQVGLQRFFTEESRPFCFYAVIRSRYGHAGRVAPSAVAALRRVAESVRIAPRPVTGW